MKFSNGSEIKTEKEVRNIKGGLWPNASTPTAYVDNGYYPIEYPQLFDYEEYDETSLTFDGDKYIVGKKDISFEQAFGRCIQEIDNLREQYSNKGVDWTYNGETYKLSTSQNARVNTKSVMDDAIAGRESKDRKWITNTGKVVQVAKQDVSLMYDAIKNHLEIAFEKQATLNESVYASTTVGDLRSIIQNAKMEFL